MRCAKTRVLFAPSMPFGSQSNISVTLPLASYFAQFATLSPCISVTGVADPGEIKWMRHWQRSGDASRIILGVLGAAVARTHSYSRIRKKPPIDDRRTSSQILIRYSTHDFCAENSIRFLRIALDGMMAVEMGLKAAHQSNVF